ncbi:MAG: dihydroorotase [Bacillota bacterium]
MVKILYKNCSIISPNIDPNILQDLYVENGVIKDIGVNLFVESAKTIEVESNLLMPGMIDMHCNICDPGFENIERIETISQAALRGGFTSITSQPNTNPTVDNKTVVEYIVSKSKHSSIVNLYPYGSMSIGCKGIEMGEIGEMFAAGITAISDGDCSIENASLLRNIMLYAKMFDLPVVTHCEDRNLSGKGVINAGYMATKLGLIGMPKSAEETIVARNVVLAQETGTRLHISHISTRASVQIVREAKKRGLQVTAETSPHYFLLTEDAVGDYNTLMKVNPPLRTQDDVEAILEGLADGTIDVISSSHSPSSYRDKDMIFDQAVYGVSSLETLLPLCYTHLVKKEIITLERLVELTSSTPARILKLLDKGAIYKGKDADFIIVNTKTEYKIDPLQFVSKAKFSPFENEKVFGKVVIGVVGGKFHSFQ